MILMHREVTARRATLLVLDGISEIEARAGTGFEMKQFTHELQTLASATSCTMVLLTTAMGPTAAAEHTMVDGLIELRQRPYGARNERRQRGGGAVASIPWNCPSLWARKSACRRAASRH